MSRPQRATRRVTIWLLVVSGIAGLLFCMGAVAYVEVPLWLAFGWVAYLIRVVPEITVSWPSLGMGAATFAAFAVGLHLSASQVHKGLQADPVQSRWRKRWTAALVGLVVMMFVSGIGIVGVTHQIGWLMTQEERWVESSFNGYVRRIQSKNNLKQIGLALHNYHDEFDRFAPGGTFDSTGRPLHSWETHLLPFLDQRNLYDQIDLSQRWTAEENTLAFQTIIQPLLNPGIGRVGRDDEADFNEDGFALSHYAANVRMFGPNRCLSFERIPDGTSNTIMAGEISRRLPAWGDPVNWRDLAAGINASPHGFGGPWTGGAQFLFSDGSTWFLSDQIDLSVLNALSTPAGAEDLSGASW